MKTITRISRKTGQVSIEVEGAVGGECRTKNAPLYERFQKEMGLELTEEAKPEMELTEQEQMTHS